MATTKKSPWLLRLCYSALQVGILAYAGLTLLLMLLQTRIIFPASREMWRMPGPPTTDWDFEEVRLKVNGETTYAWYVPLENARGTVLFSHGNAGNLSDRLESIALLRKLGFSVFAYDYGGYGNSTGRPSESRCYADVRAAWRYLTEEREIAPDRIVLFGRSLGAAVTLDLATEVTPAAVVAESAFRSTGAVAHEMYPFLPVRWLLRHRFDNEGKVAGIHAPLLVIHSPEDDIIPFSHGKALFAKAPEPKMFLEIHGGHNEGFVLSMDVYLAGWEDFLEPLLPGNGNW